MLVPRAKPATAKGSLTKTCCFALTLPHWTQLRTQTSISMQPLSPEHNFLLHQISERANLILDARGFFSTPIPKAGPHKHEHHDDDLLSRREARCRKGQGLSPDAPLH